ncbi:aldehyde dehydrogenase family protein [Gordonia tangerina]|uniref:Aldehyde dehydrogenase n=1 Tax=Gordonia tangerina TaxID=2911060 RepID=A0ABS9DKB8_9ACTN|nr:aldehyde dehydrogenase family protein [Gordonia tangerina]MCF3939672.1 aldehyde dehydrogenase family protein [Gordonia tangerina]
MSVTDISPAARSLDWSDDLAVARAAFGSGRTRALSWRIAQLEGLLRFIDECEKEIVAAIDADLGRGAMATFMADVAPVRHEIKHTLAKVGRWMKPERVRMSAATSPGKAWVVAEPKGVALILGAWNFPILLTLHPLVSCLAAGNAAVVKPSEIAENTAQLLAQQLPRFVDAEAVRVVIGDATVSASLAGQPFDHTFFTGSTNVGRAVMEASARNLTPVTLELGGKSPVIVAADADLDVAARRIAWAKSVNAGQTCTAPDYVLVEESVRPALVERLLAELPHHGSHDTTRIVNDRHVERLQRVLAGHGGEQFGGAVDTDKRTVTPALITDPSLDSELMCEEIFGPVLPLVSVRDLDDAIDFVNARPKPLALYLFTESRDVEQAVVARTSSGSVTVNHLLYHLLVPELPFGGVGGSGMGNYHGKNGFDTFSHRKAILRKASRPDLAAMYPPYSRPMQAMMRRLMG